MKITEKIAERLNDLQLLDERFDTDIRVLVESIIEDGITSDLTPEEIGTELEDTLRSLKDEEIIQDHEQERVIKSIIRKLPGLTEA